MSVTLQVVDEQRTVKVSLELSSELTVAHVVGMIEAECSVPRMQQRLYCKDVELKDLSLVLADYYQSQCPSSDSILELRLVQIPLIKGRCQLPGCMDRVAKIVGDCRYCDSSFCGRHRLPESHSCKDMQTCRQQSFERNSSKLLGEKCVADKF